MKNQLPVLLVIITLFSGCFDGNENRNQGDPFKHPEGELFVRLANGVELQEFQQRLDGIENVSYVRPLGNGHVIKVPVEDELLWFLNFQSDVLLRTAQYNRFGYDYQIIVSDSLPYLEGNQLFAEIKYAGCDTDQFFTLEFDPQNSEYYQVWLYKETPDQTCTDSLTIIDNFSFNINVGPGLEIELIDPYELELTINE